MLVEHDSVPWEALPGQMDRGRRRTSGAYRIWPVRLSHSYPCGHVA